MAEYKDDGTLRSFQSGATRDTSEGKLDLEGFLSPTVMKQFAKYMNMNRLQSDGKLRDSDNWQKGIPLKAYMKSGFRHFTEWWEGHRSEVGMDRIEVIEFVAGMCGLMFNVMGYLHETLKVIDMVDFDGDEPTAEMAERQAGLEEAPEIDHPENSCRECGAPEGSRHGKLCPEVSDKIKIHEFTDEGVTTLYTYDPDNGRITILDQEINDLYKRPDFVQVDSETKRPASPDELFGIRNLCPECGCYPCRCRPEDVPTETEISLDADADFTLHPDKVRDHNANSDTCYVINNKEECVNADSEHCPFPKYIPAGCPKGTIDTDDYNCALCQHIINWSSEEPCDRCVRNDNIRSGRCGAGGYVRDRWVEDFNELGPGFGDGRHHK